MHREIFEMSESGGSSEEDEQNQQTQAAVVYRKKPNKSMGSRIISNPKLVKSLAEEDELERLSKRLSFNANTNNAKRTSTYIYCEPEEQNTKNQSVIKKRRRYSGIILAILTSIAFSLSSLIVKAIPEYHPYSVVVWTFQGILLPSIPVVIFHRCINKENICNTVVGFDSCATFKIAFFVLLRGLLGAGGIVLRCYSLQYMNMADSTVIAFSSPIFVVIIAWFFLGEKCGVVPILAAIVTLVGVGLIARPPVITGDDELDKDQIIGASMSLGCMLLGTFAVVVLRYIREVHFALVTLVYGLVGTVGGLSLALATGNFEFPKGTLHWFYAVGIALLTFIGQSSLTLALKFEQAGPVSLIRTSEIIFAFLWEFIFLGVIPDWISLVGGCIVMLGVILITLRSWLNTLPENHGVRRKCCLLLK